MFQKPFTPHPIRLNSVHFPNQSIHHDLTAAPTEIFTSELNRVLCNRLVINDNSEQNTKNRHVSVKLLEGRPWIVHCRPSGDAVHIVDFLGTLRRLTHALSPLPSNSSGSFIQWRDPRKHLNKRKMATFFSEFSCVPQNLVIIS